MTRIALALAAALLASPALALEAPPRSPDDPNMRVVPYNAMQRVRIIGTIGRATNLTYSKREHVVRIVFGDEGLWEGPAAADLKNGLKNNLPLWPRKVGQTNLLVTTEDEKGEEHVYQYALVARPAIDGDDAEAIYGLTYSYAAQDRADRAEAARVAWAPIAAAKAEAKARAKLVQDRAQAPRNWRYIGRGSVALAPAEVWDDGQQTFLRYQGQQPVPAVFSVAPDGSEQTAMTSMDGETLVVHRVSAELHLRLGAAVLYVWNRAYNPIGINPATGAPADPGTGTSSPNVIRTLRQAAGNG